MSNDAPGPYADVICSHGTKMMLHYENVSVFFCYLSSVYLPRTRRLYYVFNDPRPGGLGLALFRASATVRPGGKPRQKRRHRSRLRR